jgi:heme/copper-type cytochrome/quinol oxidase subunit 2
LYTYVIVNALFKIIFIWMVYTTIRFRRNKWNLLT